MSIPFSSTKSVPLKGIALAFIVGVTLAISGCASTSYKKVTSMDVRVGMQGKTYFCIYGRSWNMNGWHHPMVPPTKEGLAGGLREACTVTPPFKDKIFYTHYGSGDEIIKEPLSQIEVTFKRKSDGPIIKVAFDLKDKLKDELPWQSWVINPRITETGVELWRVDIKYTADRGNTGFKDVFIEFKKDGE